jgi:hypothetical protein
MIKAVPKANEAGRVSHCRELIGGVISVEMLEATT